MHMFDFRSLGLYLLLEEKKKGNPVEINVAIVASNDSNEVCVCSHVVPTRLRILAIFVFYFQTKNFTMIIDMS